MQALTSSLLPALSFFPPIDEVEKNALDSDGGPQPQPQSIQPSSQGGVTISPESRLKNLLTGSSRFEVRDSTLTITIKASARQKVDEMFPTADDPGLEMILRTIAKDEDDYQRLKRAFKKSLEQAREAMSGQQQSSPGPLPQGSTATVEQMQSYTFSLRVTQVEGQVEVASVEFAQSDPLILDMAGTGIELTDAGKGAIFDINADGKLESTAWVKGSSAMLVMDKNNNGLIDNGKELFGDQNGAAHGFQELARYDSNSDGVIDRRDPVFMALKVYQDMNSNGRFDRNEISSVDKVGIESINLDFSQIDKNMSGNRLILKGSFTTKDGVKRDIADALLGYRV
jgi:hypothetical protein